MARKSTKVADIIQGIPELVVMTRRETALRASAGRMESLAGETLSDLDKALKKHKGVMKPMFGFTEERVQERLVRAEAAAEKPMADLSVFYSIEVPEKEMKALCEALNKTDQLAAAYIKPPTGLPEEINAMAAAAVEPPSASPDFAARQLFLDPPPEGVNARWAWTQAGGRGSDVRIVDIEGAWRFTHEDLTQNQGGVVAGTEYDAVSWRNHGTAVLGEYGGDANGFGIVGICSEAIASAVSHGGLGSAGAMNQAAQRLRPGDIMLLEMHRPGPRHDFDSRSDQRGYIAVEWWPDDFAAILNASRAGIIVVEAAGNGAEDLDDHLYETPGFGFPADWKNPFRRSNRDSGAIVIGAGAPPPGTHGSDHGPDRSRLGFSNFGALVDAQGWGREVTTCGYGDLQGGESEDLWYTDRFSGTSSASPIVTGVIGCIQGMAKARGRAVLTPAEVRNALRTTGSQQENAPGRPRTQRIGNRPDIRAISQQVFGRPGKRSRIAFRRKIDRCRPLEIRALLDGCKELSSTYDAFTLQGGLVSAQSLRAEDSTALSDLAILFRFSSLEGQSVNILGPIGSERYLWMGIIAADGLGDIHIERGSSSSGSHYFDLVAMIQGVEVRYVYNDEAQRYLPQGGGPGLSPGRR